MIHIGVAASALRQEIEATLPAGWFTRAKKRAALVRAAGHVGEGDGIWSEIKEVFILKQQFKCIYCEFPMPKIDSRSASGVKVDYDVEHFRPKNRVTGWPTAEVLGKRPATESYRADVRTGSGAGYLRLAFDPLNYIVSCKVCNTFYKADRFPIAGTPDARAKQRLLLDQRERPLLLFPFGDDGDEPLDYVVFDGPTIAPRPVLGHDLLRARVVIDFFELDTREDLLEGRCLMVQLLWPHLETLHDPDADAASRTIATNFLNVVLQQIRLPHTACGRAFIALHGTDRARARRWYNLAVDYMTRKDPEVFRNVS
jgi:hypothetical protein